MWQSLIFKQDIFPAENAGNMTKKPIFGIFLRFHHLFFLIFLHKDACQYFQKGVKNHFTKKEILDCRTGNVPEIVVFSFFQLT